MPTDPEAFERPKLVAPIQGAEAYRNSNIRHQKRLRDSLRTVKIKQKKDVETEYLVHGDLDYTFEIPKGQAGSRYMIDLNNEDTWTIRQILHCDEPECFHNPHAAKAIWDLYQVPPDLQNQAELEALNGHPRAAVKTDLRFLRKVGEVIVKMERLHLEHEVYFTEKQIGPLRCYLSLTGLLDWTHVTRKMLEKWLGGLPFGIQPAVVIYNLICALENLVDQAKEMTRLTQRTDIDRNELDASHARWMWEKSEDESEDEPREAAFQYQNQQEVFFTGNVIHPLPHQVAQDQHYDKANLEALFKYTRQAEYILSELEVPNRSVCDFDREIGRSLIQSLKRLYLVNLDYVWCPSRTQDPSGQELHKTEIQRSDPSYCVLDIMPRWWGIPLLVARLITVLGLNIPDLDEENELDQRIEAALDEATASITQSSQEESSQLNKMNIDHFDTVSTAPELGSGHEVPVSLHTNTSSTDPQSTEMDIDWSGRLTSEHWRLLNAEDLLEEIWR
ncbi:hypothetical protein KCU93_g2664, partial [Aureobasidium melanogenum]